jgi:hypothetical protein
VTDPTLHPELTHAPVEAPSEVARQLSGDLLCVVCGYNLRGLSVRHVCPECATPVRATVLAVVDPYATVLQPIRFPRLIATGLLLWSGAALAASLLTWCQRVRDGYSILATTEVPAGPFAHLAVVMIIVSTLGGLVLIRPHARIPLWQSIAAAAAVLACISIAIAYWQIHGRYDAIHSKPFVESPSGKGVRTWMRILNGALIAAAVIGFRPNARLLAARSLVLRMGRTDRQTMLAMVGALAAAGVGDILRLIGLQTGEPLWSVLNTTGIMLIAVGSLLFTIGLVGVLIDCIRIASVIVRPAASMTDIVGAAAP